ncbi:MAG TPA: Spy/CpxP family protein refolding chaperone [Burkholderiales bacterium]|jgi:Spy/CpxP family protein refolding chaperone|nr:Spy/CpxP family protein refolding chaperone [Burkholderiales bacterium]
MKRRHVLGAALAIALALGAPLAGAQGPGYGYGPGAMGGYGPGMMGGNGGGMMGGYGGGMGGYGGPMAALNLTDEQQDKLFALQEANRKKNWDTMSNMRSETFKLRRMYNADSVDSKALLEQQKKVDDLRRQMLASRLDTRKQMESVLTPEQRKQLRQFGPWWMREDAE